MPHDTTTSDIWYHDLMGELCFMVLTPTLVEHMLQHPDRYSKEDIIDELKGIKKHYDKGQAMIYGQYLEMKRLENAKKQEGNLR